MFHLSDQFNKAFESKVRLGIMSILMVNDSADFGMLKEVLQLTDGNLASHAKSLEELGYIIVTKQFVGRKPNTSFKVSKEGKEAFHQHLNALEAFLKGNLNT